MTVKPLKAMSKSKVFSFLLFVSLLGSSIIPLQTVDAFVTNQLGSTLLGSSDISRANDRGFNETEGITFDALGNLWVPDFLNNRVLKFTPSFSNGQAASLVLGQPNISSTTANNGGISANSLMTPHEVKFDSSGNLWVVEKLNNRVLMYTDGDTNPSTSNFVTGQAASLVLGQSSFTTNTSGTTSSTFSSPTAIAFDSSGNAWVSDAGNNRVLKFTTPFSTGQAASLVIGQSVFTSGTANQGGSPTANTLDFPHHLHFDSSGNLLVTDTVNNRVLKFIAPFSTNMSASGVIGQSSFSFQSPGTTSTTLYTPTRANTDSSGNLWVSDGDNNRVLRYTAPLSTGQAADLVIGQSSFTSGSANQGGTVASNTLVFPESAIFDTSGNMWISDSGNNRILKFTTSFSTNQAASLVIGQPNMVTNDVDNPGVTGSTKLFGTEGLSFDSSGNVFVADSLHDRIVRFTTPFSNAQTANLVIGQPDLTTVSTEPPSPSTTTLAGPEDAEIDSSGNLWVADAFNNRILRYSAPLSTGQAADLVIGQSVFTTSSSGTTSSTLTAPVDLEFDSSGNLWLVDSGNHRVLKYATPFSTGMAATLVIGQSLFTTSATSNLSSGLNNPSDVDFDSSGNLWVADESNNRINRYAGTSFISGQSTNLTLGQTVSEESSTSGTTATTLFGPTGIIFDSSGNLWAADASNNRVIRYNTPFSTGQAASDVIGQPNLTSGTANNGGLSTNPLNVPIEVNFDSSGRLWITDSANNRVIIHSNLAGTTTTDYNLITTGANSQTLGSLTTTFTGSGPSSSWSDANLNIQKTLSNPVSSTFPTTGVGAFYEIVTNSPDIISSRMVEITYTNGELGSVDESTVQIYRHDGTSWSALTTSVNAATNTASASTSGYSVFALGGTVPPPGPSITTLVADDPNGGADTGFSAGDTITVRFSEATNRAGFGAAPAVLTKANVDALFSFSQSLGTDYTATWTTPSTLTITSVNPTGSTATIGVLTATVQASANLKNAAGTSAASTSTSPALSGSFGTFTESDVLPAGVQTSSTPLPSGQTLEVTTPAGSAGTTITVTRDTATVPATLTAFLANVVDITSSGNQCNIAPGCTIKFTFDESDLAAAGLTLPTEARITHDKNNDGDFDDTAVNLNADTDTTDCGEGNELLTTTVTPTTAPGPFIAEATDCFTSKFAIGGIRALALGGASGDFSPPSFSSKAFSENEYPLTIDGTGYKLDKYSQTIPTISLETGKPIQIKTLLYDGGGASSIHHLAMYLNLRGLEREISQSDTYIIYDKSSPVTVSDPNGFFSSVTMTPKNVGNKLELSFDVTFAKPMEKSDMIFRMWDDKRNNADTKVFDAIIVTGPEVQAAESILDETAPTVQIITPKSIDIPVWVKDNAGWWKDGQIADSEFISGMQYLIQNDIMKIPETEESAYSTPQQIPSWIKNNAGWWKDGLISDSEFVSAIQWLVSNGIMKIS